MPKVTFAGATRLITVNGGITSLNVGVDLYSDWKEWQLVGDNVRFTQAMRAVGGDPTTVGKVLGATYFLMNGWRIRPDEVSHRLAVTGNLYTEEGASPFLATLGAYTVTIISEVANLVDSVNVLVEREMVVSREVVLINDKPYLQVAPGVFA